MSDYHINEHLAQIDADYAPLPTDDELRIAYNLNAVEGLKHALKPTCDARLVRIKLHYTLLLDGRSIEGQTTAFDTMAEARKFVNRAEVEVVAVYYFEDKSVRLVSDTVKKRVAVGLKTPRSTYQFVNGM